MPDSTKSRVAAPRRVTKLDVAARQLSAAIRLFFTEWDAVAVHTLAAAAHQILVDLGKRQGIESVVKNTSRMTKPEARRFLKTINYPYNFLKHADQDPEGTMYVVPLDRFAQDFLMDAVLMLQRMAHDIPFAGKVFWHWYVSKYPAEFEDLPKDGEVAKMQKLHMADMAFREIAMFLKFNDAFGDQLPD